MHVGLALHPDTHDVFFTDNSLTLVYGAEAVGQHVKQRLKTFQGEWFLDTNHGVPWLQEIFAKKYDPALADAVVKATVLDTDGVTEINEFSISYKRDTRGLIIKEMTLSTVYDVEVTVYG